MMVETVLSYWSMAMKECDKKKILTVEMDYLRKIARTLRLERVPNEQ